MTIILNHTIVPARDKLAAARWFAGIFGLNFNKQESDHFGPVRVNETLTLLFDEATSFDSHHYAFHVSEAEFDAIFERIKKAGLSYGSATWNPDARKLAAFRPSVITVADLDTHIVIAEVSQHLRSGFGQWRGNLHGTDPSRQPRRPRAALHCDGVIMG